MSFNKDQLLNFIIRPTLQKLNLASASAENLLLGTCAHESKMGTYLHQVGGPALGIYQIEPKTHQDVLNNFIIYNNDLRDKLNELVYNCSDRDNQLIGNLYYSTAICRIIYLRAADPLPLANDVEGLAKYWKKYYNTSLGKGDIEQFIADYQKYIN